MMGETGGLINALIAVLTLKTKGRSTSLLFNPLLNLPHNGEEAKMLEKMISTF
tara:strand:- start:405 stop:563 length:159 start_codon:yes stop_codon:yes gene_type:complete